MDQLKYISSLESQHPQISTPQHSVETRSVHYFQNIQYQIQNDRFLSSETRNILQHNASQDFRECVSAFRAEKTSIYIDSQAQRTELHTSYLESLRNTARDMMYHTCGISENQEDNNCILNFLKGCLDTWILENIELVHQIVETKGAILLDIAKTLLSPQWWIDILKGIGESLRDLLTGNAYAKWVAAAGIVWGIVWLGKKLIVNAAKRVRPTKLSHTHTPEHHARHAPETHTQHQNIPEHQTSAHISDRPPSAEVITSHQIPERKNPQPLQPFRDTPESLERYGLARQESEILLASGTIQTIPNTTIRTLTERFHQFDALGIPYRDMIQNLIQKHKVTQFQATLMLLYTDMSISPNLNTFLRFPKSIPSEQLQAVQRIQKEVTLWSKRMPDMGWPHPLVLRSDQWPGRTESSFRLKAFTSVTQDIQGTFAKDAKRDVLVHIHGLQGRVKDISEISLGVHYGRSARKPDWLLPELLYMENEWIILPGARMKHMYTIPNQSVYSSATDTMLHIDHIHIKQIRHFLFPF